MKPPVALRMKPYLTEKLTKHIAIQSKLKMPNSCAHVATKLLPPKLPKERQDQLCYTRLQVPKC